MHRWMSRRPGTCSLKWQGAMSNNVDLQGATWFKSSHSNGDGNCVETAVLSSQHVAARDSKQSTDGPVLINSAGAWESLIDWIAGR
ncbi:DUF397 domain-containing protein [Streptomyces sp. NPDC058268]|uniref:DUF397 domain-containing protein n=1 Tax=Streptomyces sp. NPDC058268 TaxID=3346413 RepID=UPI0036E88606